MKKALFAVVLMTAFSVATYAQQGNNQIGIGAEVGIPTGDFGEMAKTGFGGSVKGLFGVGQGGQITLTSGYTAFKNKDEFGGNDVTTNIIPILAGYRHNFSGFYVEPQAGYGIYGMKVKFEGQTESDSEGAFTWAIGAGYQINGFDISARYQSGKLKDADAPFSLVGIRVGYNFSLGGAAASK